MHCIFCLLAYNGVCTPFKIKTTNIISSIDPCQAESEIIKYMEADYLSLMDSKCFYLAKIKHFTTNVGNS